MNINIKEPSTVLAILLIVGMIVGPWFVHDRALTRTEYRLAELERTTLNLSARMAGVETSLVERKASFERTIDDVRRGLKQPEWPAPEKH